MKPIFTAEDFSRNEFITREFAAKFANEKIESLLGPVVYGQSDMTWTHIQGSMYRNGVPDADTHTARLFNIQELPKKECEHEPVSVLSSNIISTTICKGAVGFSFFNADSWVCAKCGVKLKAR